jgi:uncharacterized lipoprotein YajG
MHKYLLILITPIIFSGCAFMTDEIHVPHQPGKNFTMLIPGAEKITVEVQNEDKRSHLRDRVSTKKNGYGIEMAKITSTNDIAQTFADAIALELESCGFKMGTGGKIVKVELLRFYNDFKIGFFTPDAVADGMIKVIVLNQKGTVLFTSVYDSSITHSHIAAATGSSARKALMEVMTAIVDKVAMDETLHAALLKN